MPRPLIRNKSAIVAARRKARAREKKRMERRMSSPFASPRFVADDSKMDSNSADMFTGGIFSPNKYDSDTVEDEPELTPREILQNFVQKILNKNLLQGWNMWTDYVKRHRAWIRSQQLNSLSNKMLKLTSKFAAGERPGAAVNVLCSWALSDAGVPILKKLESKTELQEITQNMIVKRMAEHEVLFMQGQSGSHFWYVVEGQIRIFVEDNENKAQVKLSSLRDPTRGMSYIHEMIEHTDHGLSYLGREVLKVAKGKGFGEIALIEGDGVRNATAVAVKNTIIMGVPKHVYLKTISKFHIEARQREQKQLFLMKLPLFSSWSKRRVIDTSFTLSVREYKSGGKIFSQNSPSNRLMFIKSGSVSLHHRLRPMLPGEGKFRQEGVGFCEGKRIGGWKKEPVMRLSVLGPGNILGLQAPLFAKAQEKEKTKSERDNKTSDGKKKADSKDDKGFRAEKQQKSIHRNFNKTGEEDPNEIYCMPWSATASTDVQLYVVEGKALLSMIARSVGTGMLQMLKVAFQQRLNTYKERCKAANFAGAFSLRMPKKKAKPFHTPSRPHQRKLGSRKHSISLPQLASHGTPQTRSTMKTLHSTASAPSPSSLPPSLTKNITGNLAENTDGKSFEPGGSAILPPISHPSNSSTTPTSSNSMAKSRRSMITLNLSDGKGNENRQLSKSKGSISLWATSAIDSFYTSKSTYIDPDSIGGQSQKYSDSVFEVDALTASLLRKRNKYNPARNNKSGRRETLTAAIGAPVSISSHTIGVSAGFLGESKALEIENHMKISGPRVRKSHLNRIGKLERRKATDIGRNEKQSSARSVALDRALNKCLEAHFAKERAKLH